MSFIDARMVYDSDGKNISNKIGLLTNLTTQAKSDLVSAINENEQGIGNLTSQINYNPNLLFNPSFSLGTLGWTLSATTGTNGWKAMWGGYGEGSYIASPSNDGTGYNTIYSTPIITNAGNTFIYSADVDTHTMTSGTVTMDVQSFDVNGNLLNQTSIAVQNFGINYTRLSGSFTTPTNTDHFLARLVQSNDSVGTFRAKRIKVEIGSIETIYSDDSSLNIQQYGQQLYPSLFSGNGYQKLPNGLIIQWGRATVPSQVMTTFTLPITFPTYLLQADANVVNAPGFAAWNPISNSQIGLYQSTTSSAAVSYIAIGY